MDTKETGTALVAYKPPKGTAEDWLTRWHLEKLTIYFGAIQTGSSVLGGELPDSDIDVFIAYNDYLEGWLKIQGFETNGGELVYPGVEFTSYRHSQSWVNVIVLEPFYYPCFKHQHDSALKFAGSDSMTSKAYRKSFFRQVESEWFENRVGMQFKPTQ